MFSNELLYKSICANRHTDAYEAVRAEGVEGNLAAKRSQLRCGINETVRHIKDSLLGNSFRKNSSLGNMKLQTCIFFEYTLKLSQHL